MEVGAADLRPGEGGEGRTRKRPATYDETRRRTARRKETRGYMERSGNGGGRKRVLPSGGLVVDRVVRGRYEWRDSLLPAKRRRE